MQTILDKIAAQTSGLICLSAPTKSGKTALLRTLKDREEKTLILSAERFASLTVQYAIADQRAALPPLFDGYRYIAIEDIDWFKERTHTQLEMAALLAQLAKKAVVIISGIDLQTRMASLFSKLTDYTMFEKANNTADWIHSAC